MAGETTQESSEADDGLQPFCYGTSTGGVCYRAKDLADAERKCREETASFIAVSPESRDVATLSEVRSYICLDLAEQSDGEEKAKWIAEAVSSHEKGLAIWRKLNLGEWHLPFKMTNMAGIYLAAGKLEEADRLCREAAELYKTEEEKRANCQFGKMQQEAWVVLEKVLRQLGKHDEAEQLRIQIALVTGGENNVGSNSNC